MSDALIRELAKELDGGIFHGLLDPGAGFRARKGIGTYKSFLEEAGLRPPYTLPRPSTAAREAFHDACLRKARTIVRGIDRSEGLAEPLGATVIKPPCTIHRVVNAGADGGAQGQWGGWWFSDQVLQSISEQSRKRGGQILGDREFRALLRENLRRALAIRVDWNAMVYLCSMKILHGTFPVITGTGRAQPVRTPSPTERGEPPVLRGGYQQIWLPWTPGVFLDQTPLT